MITKYEDITGRLFGRLTALHKTTGTKWLCKCDCGNEKEVEKGGLTSGRTRSCGCLRQEVTSQRFLKDYTGQQFGKLLVLERAPSRGNNSYWLCQCECGNQKEIYGKSLQCGDVRSCGCIRTEKTAEHLAKRAASHARWAWRKEKPCLKCKEVFPVEDFPRNASSPDGRGSYCKPCHSVQGRENRTKNHGSRGYHLKRRYGITQEDFNRLLEQQQGACAICNTGAGEKPWHVDHDHSTGRVRGILCHSCNTALGNFKDSTELLRSALDYLLLGV